VTKAGLSLRPDNCGLAEYKAWFQEGCDGITLEPGFTLIGPILTDIGDSPPWSLDFAIMYSDGMYIRIGESYRPLSRRDGGGGRLHHLSYHYGLHKGGFKADGFPAFVSECEIRIDIDSVNSRHAHYQGEDHIPEARVPGLNFDSIDPFKFILAIEEYRKTARPLHEILEFTVVEP
jgi:hypothetical protein